MIRKGRESYRKPPPLRMRVSVNVWHSNESSCWILWFIGITLGITICLSSYEACNPSRDWRMQFFLICDHKCEPKDIPVYNKKRLYFCLMALPILSLSTWSKRMFNLASLRILDLCNIYISLNALPCEFTTT